MKIFFGEIFPLYGTHVAWPLGPTFHGVLCTYIYTLYLIVVVTPVSYQAPVYVKSHLYLPGTPCVSPMYAGISVLAKYLL